MKTFVSHGADINVKDYDNNSLLHASKQAEMSLFLLQTWSLSPGAKNRFGKTALHRVARLTGMIKVSVGTTVTLCLTYYSWFPFLTVPFIIF